MNKKVLTANKAYICCAVLIIIALSGVAYIKWSSIKDNFFDIRLSEICQICINIVLAFYIGLHLNLRVKNIEQKKLLILDLLNELYRKIEAIYKLGNNYIASNSSTTDGQSSNDFIEMEKKLLIKLKDFAFNLSSIKETFNELDNYRKHNLIVDIIKKNYMEFKVELTGSKSSQTVDNTYRIIIKNIKKLKLKIYE